MTPEQFNLVNRSTAPWLTLWLITDFDGGRSHAVGGQGGGTYHFGDGGRGQYETTGKGMSAWRSDRTDPEVAVTWGEVRKWVESLSTATREIAATIRREGADLQRAYPNPYPGIGRAYHWDTDAIYTRGGCEQCDRDRADLATANEKRALEVDAWQARRREHDARVKAFLTSLAPESEPDLLALMGASS